MRTVAGTSRLDVSVRLQYNGRSVDYAFLSSRRINEGGRREVVKVLVWDAEDATTGLQSIISSG
jgi:hypothetical protein